MEKGELDKNINNATTTPPTTSVIGIDDFQKGEVFFLTNLLDTLFKKQKSKTIVVYTTATNNSILLNSSVLGEVTVLTNQKYDELLVKTEIVNQAEIMAEPML